MFKFDLNHYFLFRVCFCKRLVRYLALEHLICHVQWVWLITFHVIFPYHYILNLLWGVIKDVLTMFSQNIKMFQYNTNVLLLCHVKFCEGNSFIMLCITMQLLALLSYLLLSAYGEAGHCLEMSWSYDYAKTFSNFDQGSPYMLWDCLKKKLALGHLGELVLIYLN